MSEGLVLQVGRYGLFGAIAEGGMAEVHFGRQAGEGGFQKTIAIKRLLPHVAQNPDCRTMIYEEARIASRIRHPNVVQPLDVITTDDEVLLAMEYVHGESLSKLVRRATKQGERVPVPIAMAIVCEMLHGLHAAHEAKDSEGVPLGIVHRDVSPQNVIVGVDGVSRVIDFGIAKAVNSSDVTQVGHVKGKLPYIAPELLAGEAASRSSDIYAAACIAWEVLVGKRLFEGDNDRELAARILRAPVDPPSAFVADVPPEIDAIILRGVDRNPEGRFATAREMALEIERYAPLATASTIGALVEHLAGAELQQRAEKLARVERMQFDYVPEPGSRRSRPSLDAPISQPTLPRSSASQPAPPISQAPSAPPAASIRPPAWRNEVKPPAAGELRKPALEIPNVAWLPDDGGKGISITKPRKVSGTTFALVVILLALGGFFVALPKIVQRGYEKGALAQGITLTIASTEVTRHTVKLVDVGVKVPELPWLSAHAAAVEIELAGIDTRAITVRGLDVQIDGALADVEKDVERFRAVHKIGTPDDSDARHRPKLTVEAAHATWRGALGKETMVTAENVGIDMFGDDDISHVNALLVRVIVQGAGAFGPVRVDYERSAIGSHTWLRFDPSGARTSSIVFDVDQAGASTLVANIPRARAGEIFLRPSFGVTDVTLTLKATLDPRGRSEGHLNATFGLATGAEPRGDEALTRQEVHLDEALAAPDSNSPLVVTQGTADIAGQKLRPGGSLSFSPAGIELALFASCDAKPDASVVQITLDTKDVSNAALSIKKDARCGKAAK